MRSHPAHLLLAVLMLTSACTPAPPPPPPPAPPITAIPKPSPPPPVSTPAPVPAPQVALSTSTSIDAYKREFAQRVLDRNADRTFTGRLPPELYGVVVLKIVLDRNGQPTSVQPMRVPPHAPELGPVAVASVRQGAPYVRPSSTLLAGKGSMELVETWLFRQDGQFQIRTLAGPQ